MKLRDNPPEKGKVPAREALQPESDQHTARELLNIDERTKRRLAVLDLEKSSSDIVEIAETAVSLIILFPELADQIRQKVPLEELQKALSVVRVGRHQLARSMARLYPAEVSKPSFSLLPLPTLTMDQAGQMKLANTLDDRLERCYQNPQLWPAFHEEVQADKEKIAQKLRSWKSRVNTSNGLASYAAEAAAFLVLCADEVKFHADGRVEVFEPRSIHRPPGLPERTVF